MNAIDTVTTGPQHANEQRRLLRFRPIMITAMAALLGALPLMLGTDVGSELRHPLSIGIVDGLIFYQVLTLFITPVIYLAVARLGKPRGDAIECNSGLPQAEQP